MTETPMLVELWKVGMVGVPEEIRDAGPVVMADGQAHVLDDVRAPIHAERARVHGVRPQHMDRLVSVLRTKALALYGIQVDDLSPLQRVHGLEWLNITWNTKVTSLEPLAAMGGLTRLSISDTPKVVDIEPLAALRNLVALNYSGGIWNRQTAAALEPIARLPKLQELVLTNLRVLDGGLRPLAGCPSLRAFDVSNQFDTADYAYLSVALPNTTCKHFAAYVPFTASDVLGDVMIVGRRKPFLHSSTDGARIARYVAEFERLQARFRAELATERGIDR